MKQFDLPTWEDFKEWLPGPPVVIGWVLLIVAFLVTYAVVFGTLIRVWWTEPEYGHGFFVPIFAGVLLWLRRDMIDPLPVRGNLWGIPFLVLWALLRWSGAYFNYVQPDRVSLLPFLVGLALVLGGWRALRWSWPAILFLGFMLPLPGFLAPMLSQPLQRVGTTVSVFLIQTLGIPALVRGGAGTVIVLENTELGVVEACSGLRMLMLFFAVCVGAAFVIRVPLWQKIAIVLSAPPIAVFANVMRITVTALLHHLNLGKLADTVFHDGAGLLMMPFAMLLLWGEMVLIGKLFLEPVADEPLSLGRSLAGVGPDARVAPPGDRHKEAYQREET